MLPHKFNKTTLEIIKEDIRDKETDLYYDSIDNIELHMNNEIDGVHVFFVNHKEHKAGGWVLPHDKILNIDTAGLNDLIQRLYTMNCN